MKKKSHESEMKRNEHWEMKYSPSPQGSNTPAGAFLPKQAKNRPQPHMKVNECDH